MNKRQKVWYALTHVGSEKLCTGGFIAAVSGLAMLIADSVIVYRRIGK